MSKKEITEKINFKMMDIKRHFDVYEKQMSEAENLIISGINGNNNIDINNAITILSSFVSNTNVRDVIKMAQEHMKGGE